MTSVAFDALPFFLLLPFAVPRVRVVQIACGKSTKMFAGIFVVLMRGIPRCGEEKTVEGGEVIRQKNNP